MRLKRRHEARRRFNSANQEVPEVIFWGSWRPCTPFLIYGIQNNRLLIVTFIGTTCGPPPSMQRSYLGFHVYYYNGLGFTAYPDTACIDYY